MPYRVTRYRLLMVKDGQRPHDLGPSNLRQSGDVLTCGPAGRRLDREAFYVILLDGKNRATGINL